MEIYESDRLSFHCGPWTSSNSIALELVGNANSWVSSQLKNSGDGAEKPILTNLLGDSNSS